MTSVEVRRSLVEAVTRDLVGPDNGSDPEHEILSQAPSRWYLTGFLVPLEASESQRSDETADDERDGAADEAGGTDDAHEPEKPAARRALLPSSRNSDTRTRRSEQSTIASDLGALRRSEADRIETTVASA